MARSKNVDSWMAELDPSVRQIAQAIRDLVLNTAPGLKETIKWSNPNYSKNDNVFYIAATEKYASLGFFRGASLTDPQGRIEGTGKNLRHVKVKALEDLDGEQMAVWITEAVGLDQR